MDISNNDLPTLLKSKDPEVILQNLIASFYSPPGQFASNMFRHNEKNSQLKQDLGELGPSLETAIRCSIKTMCLLNFAAAGQPDFLVNSLNVIFLSDKDFTANEDLKAAYDKFLKTYLNVHILKKNSKYFIQFRNTRSEIISGWQKLLNYKPSSLLCSSLKTFDIFRVRGGYNDVIQHIFGITH
jgi:hypothetical protein